MTTDARSRTGIRDLPAAFWWLWLAVLVTWIGRFVVPFLAIILTGVVGVPASQAGLVIAAYGAGVVVSALFGGVLADHLGRKTTLIASEIASVIVLLILPQFLDSMSVLSALLLVYGLVSGAGHPAVATLIGDMVERRHRRVAYSYNSWAVNLGYALGPILAGFLATVDYGLLFYGQAGLMTVAAIIVFVGVSDPSSSDRSLRRANGGSAGAVAVDTAAASTPSGGLTTVFKDRVFMGFTALMFVYFCVYVQSTTTMPIVMQQQGLSEQQYGYMLTLNGLLLCLLQVPAARMMAHYRHGPVLVAFMLLTAVGMAVQAWADGVWVYAIAVALWTLGELGVHPTSQSAAADMATNRVRGRYQGVYALAFSGAGMVAPIVGGFVLDEFGSVFLWLFWAAVCVVVALLLGLSADRREQRFAHIESINTTPARAADTEPSPDIESAGSVVSRGPSSTGG